MMDFILQTDVLFSICLRDVPFTMLELGIYENLKNFLVRFYTKNVGFCTNDD